MNKKTKLIIAVLVVLNLILITLLYLGRPNRGKHNSPKEIIIEKLGFDEAQQAQFQELIEKHQELMMNLKGKIKRNKTILYEGIVQDNKTYNDSIVSIIGSNFQKIEQAHYIHFLGIKNICKDGQKVKFDSLTKEFNKLFNPRPKRRNH